MNIVKGTKKGEYKEGNARLAWINLKRKYALMTAPSLMRMSELYTNAKLRKGVDPDVYITYLEDLRDHLAQMNRVVMDTQFIVKVLNSLMPKYGTQVSCRRKGSIRQELRLLHWKRSGRTCHLNTSIFKGQGDPTEIKRSPEEKWLCTPEDSLKESVEALESMATKWQIVQIRKKRMAVERPMETKQENSKGSVLVP